MEQADSEAVVSMPDNTYNSSNFDFYQQPPQEPMQQIVISGVAFSVPQSEAALILKARRNCTIANVLAIVSLFIGGMLLDVVAIVFAAMGFSNLRAFSKKYNNDMVISNALRRPGIIALVLSIIAFVLNAISFAIMFPILYRFIENNDVEGLTAYLQTGQLPNFGNGGTSTGNGGSVW